MTTALRDIDFDSANVHNILSEQDIAFHKAMDTYHREWKSMYPKRVIDSYRHFFDSGYSLQHARFSDREAANVIAFRIRIFGYVLELKRGQYNG